MKENIEPIFMTVDHDSDGFQKSIKLAHQNLDSFKMRLSILKKDEYACVKFFVPENPDSSEGANIWLMSPFFENNFFYARVFELPSEFQWLKVGQWLKFEESTLLDWYILNENAEMEGGYSLKYQRSLLPENKWKEFDEKIGIKGFI